jgi:hypothetical protein
MEPTNREQRRRQKFGKTGGATKEPWPASEVNPALRRSGEEKDASPDPAEATEVAEVEPGDTAKG